MYFNELVRGGVETGANFGAGVSSIGAGVSSIGSELSDAGSAFASSAGGGDPVTAAFQFGSDVFNVAAGVPQKQVRAARAMRDAALADERAAYAQLQAAQSAGATQVELARLAIELERARAATAATMPASSGAVGFFKRSVPVVDVPVWQVAAAAAVAALIVFWPR